MKSKILFCLSILFVIFWMIVIFFFSEAPSEKSNSGSKTIIRNTLNFIYPDKDDKEIERIVIKLNKPVRKCAHATVYFILANSVNSVVCVFKKNRLYLCNLISLIVCFLYACTDEYHQTFVSHRTGQFSDVLIDSFGALIGCLVFDFVYKLIIKRRNISEN